MFDIATIDKSIVYLALYDNKDPWDIGAKIIKKATSSDYSHCELIVGNWSYSSSIPDKGVRRKLCKDVYKYPDNWTVIPILWVKPEAVIRFFDITRDQPYGWLGLIVGQVFNIRIDMLGYFCSEWVIAALFSGLRVVLNAQQYSPEDVRSFVLAMNKVYALR
jgi:hypothetical protein